MNIKLKELPERNEIITAGHRMCAGCGAPIAANEILLSAPQDTRFVVSSSTGCMQVSTCLYPFVSWKASFIHSSFENGPATLSGIETAYNALRARGKVRDNFHFVNFAGDGGTYDIGLQALSGALERGHRMLMVCYNNEAYMNTGTQCSGATPYGSWSSTSPYGECSFGKERNRKDLTAIVAAHNIPYVAQASIHNYRDTVMKAQKAFAVNGPSFINIIAPCPRGWRFPGEKTVEMARLSFETCIWPLYEVVEGKWKLTAKPKVKKPIEDYIKLQGRFQHLFKPEFEDRLALIQSEVDEQWSKLLLRCGETE